MNDVKYIGDGKFVVTEERLYEVFSQAVSMNVADYLGVDNWQGWWDKVAKFSWIVLIFDSPELESLNYHQFQDVVEIYAIAHSQRDDDDWNAVQLFAKMILQIDRAMVDTNKRRIVQGIKTIANLEHRYNPYNSSWGLVLEYCKQLLEGEKR